MVSPGPTNPPLPEPTYHRTHVRSRVRCPIPAPETRFPRPPTDAIARASSSQHQASSPADGDEGPAADAMSRFGERLREHLNTIRNAARQVAVGQAQMLRALADTAVLHAPREGDPAGVFTDYAPEEVATVLAVSANSARNQLYFAETVARRLPHALDALEAGEIDLPRLRILEHAITPLDDAAATALEAWMLERGQRRHRTAYAAAARRAVLRLDPDGAERRARERAKERGVWIDAEEDAISTLSARLPADQAEACYRRISDLANGIARARAEDDTRTPDQIRADVLVDLLMGRGEHAAPIGCEIQVVVPITTLLGLGQEPGELAG